VTVAGTFLLPLSSFLATRAIGYPFPAPAVASAASLLFLFNEGNSMWGGNIPSTMAGEFAHSLGFALAVLFTGLIYRHIEAGTGRRRLSVILALAGLCHPVAFINAVLPGLFFLLDRQRFARNLRYLIAVYGTGALLMSFWLVPLVVKIGYATSINWTWHFQSWREVLPKILLPAAPIAALNALLIVVLPRPWNRPARYVLFGIAVTAIAFYNATSVGLPEIRFVPFGQFLMVLLALDLLARPFAFPKVAALPAIALPGLALVVGILAWVESVVGYIPSWIKWNYSGIESKPSYAVLAKIFDALRGTMQEPRVAYENSPSYEHFGSMRIFESIPHFANRATLEGLLLQTPVTSPFIYYIQSEISVAGTGVIPGYPYPSVNPLRGTRRLDLFNARDLLAVTPTVKDALAKDARWQRVFDLPPYAIFRRTNADPHYVRVPRYEPVLVETTKRRWKKDFHRWFSDDAALDVPIVASHMVPPAERARFPLTSRSATELPHHPLDVQCQIDEHVAPLEIEFTTTCPGVPHWISMSYYPNWHAEGAARVYLASPAFMLVIPDGPHVRLTFGRVTADWIGIGMTLLGLGLLVVRVPGLGYEPSALEARVLTPAQPWLIAAATVVLLAAAAWNFAEVNGPPYFYQQGWKLFEKQQYKDAIPLFERAKFLGGETPQGAEATFFRAASYLRLNQPAIAVGGYRDVIEHYPDSIWVAESNFHVGLCEKQLGHLKKAKASFRYVIVHYPGNRWAGFATEQMREVRNLARQRKPRG
jgi:6-pyruvoyl-tetrahydropterin synthase-like protein/tetratricopeptide repeat protein